MSTRRQLAGLTVGTAAGLALGGSAGLWAAASETPAAAQPIPPVPSIPGLPSRSPLPTASAAPPPSRSPAPPAPPGSLVLTARRTELTLPDLPLLGTPYVCLLDVFDQTARQIGTATASSMVVGLTLQGPVVLAAVLLHLPDGEVHYQRIINRFGGFPRTAVGAIVGGTGAYRDARGEVDISWPNDDQVDLLVRLPEPNGT